MSIDNLDIVKGLIAEKECGRVEFKETTGQLERGMETLCAFLNGKGGTVLFGVTDKGKIIGQDVSDILCIIKQKNKMIQNFTYILLCGIIILLAKFSGSECCA